MCKNIELFRTEIMGTSSLEIVKCQNRLIFTASFYSMIVERQNMKHTFVLPLVFFLLLMFSLSAQSLDDRTFESIQEPYLELIVRNNNPLSSNIRFMTRTGHADDSK